MSRGNYDSEQVLYNQLKDAGDMSLPVLVFIYEYGKSVLLDSRITELKQLVKQGDAIFIPDVRAVGETAVGDSLADYSFQVFLPRWI